MNNQNRHIIRKQIIELTLPREQGAMDLQRKISQLFQEEVLVALEQKLETFNIGERVVRIPRLEINLKSISLHQLENSFVEQCVQSISAEIKKQVEHSLGYVEVGEMDTHFDDTVIVPLDKIAQETFLYFLEKGILPWNTRIQTVDALEEAVQESLSLHEDKWIIAIKKLLEASPNAIIRLVNQFSISFLQILLQQIWQVSSAEWQSLKIKSAGITGRPLSLSEEKCLLQLAVTCLLKMKNLVYLAENQHNSLHFFIQEFILSKKCNLRRKQQDMFTIVQASNRMMDDDANKLLKASDDNLSIDLLEQQRLNKTESDFEGESFFIENAGLVILAPYLPTFFKGLELTQENTFTEFAFQERAVQLTQYLVTGEENTAEFLLPLNKLLCGVPILEPIERLLELTENEKTEAENLLNAIIRNWMVLKETSIAGLRETFLRRHAKLTYEANQQNWLLQVEKKGVDILVERIPWTISIIKLPWMPAPLYVEWV